MNVKAILFDKDGTLIDLDKTWVPVFKAFLVNEKRGGPEHTRALMVKAGYDPLTSRFLPGSLLAGGTTRQLVELWWPELSSGEVDLKVALLDSDYAPLALDHLEPILPLRPLLEDLRSRGFKLGLGTNDSYGSGRLQLEHLQILDLFDVVLGADSVATPKPSGEMVRRFAEELHITPSQVAMVGDNSHDLEEARAGGAGLAIGVLSGSSTQQHLERMADHVLGNIGGLPALLGRT